MTTLDLESVSINNPGKSASQFLGKEHNRDRILITGGGGFIGSHLARTLYKQGHFVRIVDVKFDDYIQKGIILKN